MTLNIMNFNIALSINDTKQDDMLHVAFLMLCLVSHFYYYADCIYADCDTFNVLLSVIMLSVVVP
jgi:hypothetical protein